MEHRRTPFRSLDEYVVEIVWLCRPKFGAAIDNHFCGASGDSIGEESKKEDERLNERRPLEGAAS